jgi:hypothetical protein
VPSTVGSQRVIRFGDSYVASGINDQTHYNKMYNKLGLTYENTTLGKFQFLQMILEVLLLQPNIDDKTIPASLTRNINSAGGQYEYQKKRMGSSCIQGQ